MNRQLYKLTVSKISMILHPNDQYRVFNRSFHVVPISVFKLSVHVQLAAPFILKMDLDQRINARGRIKTSFRTLPNRSRNRRSVLKLAD